MHGFRINLGIRHFALYGMYHQFWWDYFNVLWIHSFKQLLCFYTVFVLIQGTMEGLSRWSFGNQLSQTVNINCNNWIILVLSSCLNPFSTNVPLLYPLKTSKNFWFSDIFRGYRSGTLVENGLSFPSSFNDGMCFK